MYITIEDFIVAFGSDDIPLDEEGQPDQPKVDWSINAALGTANAYLLAAGLSVYDVKVQSSIKLRILDLARCELNPEHLTELVKERKADAIKFFGDVATGRAKLFAETGESSKNGGSATSRSCGVEIMTISDSVNAGPVLDISARIEAASRMGWPTSEIQCSPAREGPHGLPQ